MKKILYTFFLIAMVMLSGCDDTIVESSKIVTYKIVDIKSPKHFRVSLVSDEGSVFPDVPVSKHCNRWKEVQLGSTVKLNTLMMRRGDKHWVHIEAESICPGN